MDVPEATPSTSSLQNPVFNFPSTEGNYEVTLIVTSNQNCYDTLTQIIEVKNDLIFFVPNAFTPDGNEHNNSWKIITDGLDVTTFRLEVYDRWGIKCMKQQILMLDGVVNSKGK